MSNSTERGRRFAELHQRDEPLLLPNPWDAGTARILESLGFEALATTSLGVTNAMGVEVARALPSPFVLTARAENHLHGRNDLDDTIRRLQAFEGVGADVLYAPGLRTLDEIRSVVDAVGKPVNVVMGFADPSLTVAELARTGVRRVSIGGVLSRIALDAFIAAAREMREGRFGFVAQVPPLGDLLQHFQGSRREG